MSTKISKATRDKVCDAMAKYLEDRDWNVYDNIKIDAGCQKCGGQIVSAHNFCGECGDPVNKSNFISTKENTRLILYKAFARGKHHYNISKNKIGRNIVVSDVIISILQGSGWNVLQNSYFETCGVCNTHNISSNKFCVKCGVHIIKKVSEDQLSSARAEVFGAFKCGLRILEKQSK